MISKKDRYCNNCNFLEYKDAGQRVVMYCKKFSTCLNDDKKTQRYINCILKYGLYNRRHINKLIEEYSYDGDMYYDNYTMCEETVEKLEKIKKELTKKEKCIK